MFHDFLKVPFRLVFSDKYIAPKSACTKKQHYYYYHYNSYIIIYGFNSDIISLSPLGKSLFTSRNYHHIQMEFPRSLSSVIKSAPAIPCPLYLEQNCLLPILTCHFQGNHPLAHSCIYHFWTLDTASATQQPPERRQRPLSRRGKAPWILLLSVFSFKRVVGVLRAFSKRAHTHKWVSNYGGLKNTPDAI